MSLSVAPSLAYGEREVVDRIAAVIEDDVITLRELEEKAGPYLGQLAEVNDPAEREERRQKALREVLDLEIRDRMIDKEIEANAEKLGVTEADVDRAVDEVIKMNNLSRDQLQSALYSQGMSWSEYRKKLRKQIERARLVQFQVQGKIEIKDEVVKRRCLERKRAGRAGANVRVCASHILIRVPAAADDGAVAEAQAKAEEIRQRLVQGEDFVELARAYSGDPGAPDGDLGCFGRGEMVQAFEEAAFSMEPNEISPPVRTQFGFHVIRLGGREVADVGCDDPQELTPIQNEVYQEELERQMNAWVEELREKAFVDVRI